MALGSLGVSVCIKGPRVTKDRPRVRLLLSLEAAGQGDLKCLSWLQLLRTFPLDLPFSLTS